MQTLSKYKKIIMLSLVLIGLIIIVTAAYITEYNKNKVTIEDVFGDIEVTGTYVEAEEFLSNFDTFAVYLEENKTAYEDEETGEIKAGEMIFKIAALKKEDSNYKAKIDVKAKLGANWVKFISQQTSTSVKTTITSDVKYTPTELNIRNIEQIFPAKGKLWFTSIDNPTLYLMVTWGEIGTNNLYYTYLEYTYDEYNIDPVEIVIPKPETNPTE